ncbi:MAG: hypothetical protein Q6366_003590 [Candidatus Freyarchaeota archaeon]
MKESWRFIDYGSDDPYMNLAIEETMARSILEKSLPMLSECGNTLSS